jgi:hypothetical protein
VYCAHKIPLWYNFPVHILAWCGFIQAHLGYYVASKLRFFTPGPIHRISSRDGCYLAMGCLPLNITNIYFILSTTATGVAPYRSGVSCTAVHCWDTGKRAWIKGSRRGLFRIDELGASVGRRTGLFESYWRLRAWLCYLICHLASELGPTRNHSGCLQGQYSRVRERCGRRCMYRLMWFEPLSYSRLLENISR